MLVAYPKGGSGGMTSLPFVVGQSLGLSQHLNPTKPSKQKRNETQPPHNIPDTGTVSTRLDELDVMVVSETCRTLWVASASGTATRVVLSSAVFWVEATECARTNTSRH